MISALVGDLGFALRLLRRSPGFAATIFFVLVAGISATTAMFSIVESLVLAPLPYDHPEELTVLYGAPPGFDHFSVSYRDFLDWRAQGTSFTQMAAESSGQETLTSEGARPEDMPGASVTGDFFPMFRVHPLLGRLLDASDDQAGAPRVVVLSADLWHRRFAADPAVAGRSVALNGVAYTVVGVAQEGFRFSGLGQDRADVWLPVAAAAGVDPDFEKLTSQRDHCVFEVFGRRKPGVSVAAAQTQMASIAARISAEYPVTNATFGVNVLELHDGISEGARSSVTILLAAIGLVFLVVCANVANLLLSRGAARRGEMAVRAGLGATRGRLVMQLLIETVVLFVAAALASLVVTRLTLANLVTLLPRSGALANLEIRLDGRALFACLALSLVSALLFGLVPALVVSQVEPEQVLKQTAARAGASRSHHLVRAGLVVAQIVLAFTLLAAGGLALRAFARFNQRTPGFATEGRITGFLNLPPARYPDAVTAERFVRDLLETVKREPGVESAAIDSDLPMGEGGAVYTFAVEGRPPLPPGEHPALFTNTISTDYLGTLEIPLLRGRNLTLGDRRGSRQVMLVSQQTAARFFPGEDPIGHRITFDDTSPDEERSWIEIVGITGDVRRNGLSHPPVEEAYLPVGQSETLHSFTLVVRSPRSDLQRILPDLVSRVDPEIALSEVAPMSGLVKRSISMRRTMAMLLLGFAVTALVLAMLGIFGLVSYSTAQRTRELAIRMALGATPATVIRLVLRGAMMLVTIGLALGLVGALALGRFLSTQMPGVASFDPLVYFVVPALLLGTTLLACIAPAVRAVRVPPATALRYE